jgi:hypothetical protein
VNDSIPLLIYWLEGTKTGEKDSDVFKEEKTRGLARGRRTQLMLGKEPHLRASPVMATGEGSAWRGNSHIIIRHRHKKK